MFKIRNKGNSLKKNKMDLKKGKRALKKKANQEKEQTKAKELRILNKCKKT